MSHSGASLWNFFWITALISCRCFLKDRPSVGSYKAYHAPRQVPKQAVLVWREINLTLKARLKEESPSISHVGPKVLMDLVTKA